MSTIELTSANFDELVAKHPFICIDFWAEWCAPCKAFKAIYAMVAEQFPEVAFATCDIEANEDLAQDFEIKSVPHLMILRDQMAVYDESGMLDKEALVDLIKQAQALDIPALKAQMEQEQS